MQRRGSRMSSSSSQPLAGRRIWIAGIGGAGMSAYAALAHAWGAEVAGWDRADTPYLAHLEGIEVTIAPEPPRAPGGWEAYVSTAYAGRVEGRPRAELLAELVSLRPSIVVAGAHGKTTASAMIAFCLDRLGDDPAFLIGGEVPQLGGNARAGAGWLVVEGDESDGTVAHLRPEIAVLLNVDLDVHHAGVGTRAALETMFEDWLSHAAHVVRAEQLEAVDFELSVPGDHHRRNAAAALAALALAGHAYRLGTRARGRRAGRGGVGTPGRRRAHARRRRCRPRRAPPAGAPGVTVALARYTTLGTGGPAREFAEPTTIAQVEELL